MYEYHETQHADTHILSLLMYLYQEKQEEFVQHVKTKRMV
jgi:hypothetical protein